jgi:serine protease Do
MTPSRAGTKKISQIFVVGGAMRTGMRGGLALLATLAGIAAVAPPVSAQDLSQTFRAVNPSVVVVRTSEREVSAEGQLAKVGEVGSGVLISSDGKVMTAAHVVHLADRIVVEFLGGERVGARIIASEADADVSLLQLESVPAGALVATLGDSDRAQIGEPVFIIGAPYGIGHTLSAGHITGRHEPDTVYHDLAKAEFLQTDAAINQGNSGGPMFDMQGHVIGIVSHIISKSGGFEGLGFVVTTTLARRMLLEAPSFWTGMSALLLTDKLARMLNLPQPSGLLVQRVADGSAAAVIGIRGGTTKATIAGTELILGGDIILESVGIPMVDGASRQRIRDALGHLKGGDPIKVKVLREGQVVELSGRMP